MRYAVRNALQLWTLTTTSFRKKILAQKSNSLKWFLFIWTRLEEQNVACENKELIFPARIYKNLSSWEIVIYWLITKDTAIASLYRCKTVQFIIRAAFSSNEKKGWKSVNGMKVSSTLPRYSSCKVTQVHPQSRKPKLYLFCLKLCWKCMQFFSLGTEGVGWCLNMY